MTTKRLRILSDTEIKSLYQRPEFTSLEQRHFFDLTDTENKYVNKLPISSAVYFVVSIGYFRAKHQFFEFTFNDIPSDVQFIIDTYVPEKSIKREQVSKKTKQLINQKILSLVGYSDKKELIRSYLSTKIKKLVKYHNDPTVIFRETLDYLEQNRLVIPTYSVLQDIIGREIILENSRLEKTISGFMTNETITKIKQLVSENTKLYKLSEIKLDLKNFKYKQMVSEIKKQKRSVDIYNFAKTNLPDLDISEQNIRYYASLIFYFSPYKFRRMSDEMMALYVMCYIYQRHQKINDNITHAFTYLMANYVSDANEFVSNKIAKEKMDLELDDKKIGVLLGYYADESMLMMKFEKVANKAYKTIPKDTLLNIGKHLAGLDDYMEELKWTYIDKKFKAIKMNVRHLFLIMDIQSDDRKNIALMEAAQFLRTKLTALDTIKYVPLNEFPKKVLTPSAAKYIIENDKINSNRYEFYVYDKIRKHIKEHKVYVNDTLQFKSFEEDIKITSNWNRDRKEILKKLDKPKLTGDIEKRLDGLEDELEGLYETVNQRIASGENTHVTVETKNGKQHWKLAYPKQDDQEYDHRYFKQLSPISIMDIFDFVNEKCKFTRAFTHIKPRNSKSVLDEICIKASIIANGTRQGNYKMSKHSNLDWQSLKNTEHNFLRLDTLIAACDIILKKIITMPAFQKSGPRENIYHGTVDGSKHATVRQTAKARHSPKYFGLDKGVSALGMILNNASISGGIIGANEHESHFLYDLYHKMSLDIDMDILSTDTHGANQVNFALFDLADNVQFAPHYKSFTKKAEKLYGFKPLSDYGKYLIRPEKRISKKIIIEEWPNIQHVLAALFTKETTQSIIVSKLSSHGNQSKTKRALWEYNNILFSIYMLNYIDDPILRRSVRIVLNRGESYNKLYNAVAKVGGKRFRGLSELEIAIWHQCTRLITLVIVFYNMYMLSELIADALRRKDKESADIIAQISPLATSHIILGGFYT